MRCNRYKFGHRFQKAKIRKGGYGSRQKRFHKSLLRIQTFFGRIPRRPSYWSGLNDFYPHHFPLYFVSLKKNNNSLTKIFGHLATRFVTIFRFFVCENSYSPFPQFGYSGSDPHHCPKPTCPDSVWLCPLGGGLAGDPVIAHQRVCQHQDLSPTIYIYQSSPGLQSCGFGFKLDLFSGT